MASGTGWREYREMGPEGLGWKAWVFVAAKLAVIVALTFLILGDAHTRVSLGG